jgi:hypothetical protein
MDEAMTLRKIRLRLKQAPVGGTVIVTPYQNNVTALASVTIADGTKRKAEDGYSTAFADGDSLSFDINVTGTLTQRPKHLTILAVFDPV